MCGLVNGFQIKIDNCSIKYNDSDGSIDTDEQYRCVNRTSKANTAPSSHVDENCFMLGYVKKKNNNSVMHTSYVQMSHLQYKTQRA